MTDDPSSSRAARERRLGTVTLGALTPLDGTIALADYDPQWADRFAILRDEIAAALGPKALLIEHVGSTSVPRLAAKPVIDVVLMVADAGDEIAYVPPLERCGYVLRIREPDWFQHRLLKPPRIDGNVHVFSRGCAEIGRMLAFRDRLRGDDADRGRYERAKRELAARTWRYTQDYADAKSDVVREILGRSLAPR